MELVCHARTCVYWVDIHHCTAQQRVLDDNGKCQLYKPALVLPDQNDRGYLKLTDSHGKRITYRTEYVSCGKCDKCKTDGPSHGPYWYAYWKEAGKTKSRYLGKAHPASLADQPDQATITEK